MLMQKKSHVWNDMFEVFDSRVSHVPNSERLYPLVYVL